MSPELQFNFRKLFYHASHSSFILHRYFQYSKGKIKYCRTK